MRARPSSDIGIFPLAGSVIQDERALPFTTPTFMPLSSQKAL